MNMRIYFILAALAGSVNAEVKENLTYTYYKANADSSRSLLDILNSSSPIQKDGKIFHGYTRWDVKWYFHWFEKPNGRCRIVSVSTELVGNIQLPEFYGGVSEQRQLFNNYVSALRTHELGHYKHGQQAAETIDRNILSLAEMSSCKELGVAGNEIGYKTIKEYQDKRKKYDETTGYGRSQGAWLDR